MVMGTVLVIDDEPSIVALIEEVLGVEGYRVVAAVGEAALQCARDVHPDVILLDLMMPGLDGVEVSQRLRADPATARIPIVAMSACTQPRLSATVGLMRANDQLSKPFDMGRLCATVARWAEAI
ncbi:MAG TPA: response regulator [Chloroflexota bacterium]|nr:response regulator [Chloroflexota bacterium]